MLSLESSQPTDHFPPTVPSKLVVWCSVAGDLSMCQWLIENGAAVEVLLCCCAAVACRVAVACGGSAVVRYLTAVLKAVVSCCGAVVSCLRAAGRHGN